MAIYIIADLHLSENNPILLNAFSNFYEKNLYLNDRVIIAGDMFDLFVGVDKNSTFHQKVRQIILNGRNRGVTTLFQRGNRDFLMTATMAEYFGMRLVGDFYSLPTVKGHALLIHGDQLCLSDRKYDSFKRFSSNPIMQYLFLSLPISWRNKIGKNIRAKSMAKNHATTSLELLNSPIVKEVGKRFLESAKCNILIHGHFHVFGGEDNVFGENTYRLGLGDCGSRYSYIKIDHNEIKLVQRAMEKNF